MEVEDRGKRALQECAALASGLESRVEGPDSRDGWKKRSLDRLVG